MKNKKETVGLVAGNANENTKDMCRLLAKEGISALVMQKEWKEVSEPETEEVSQNWSGQPGKDLFFNGWKLLF